jgi:putative ABC transport system permease protein
MTLADTFSLSWRNLRQSKLRTALTTLGVAIGIASLAGMVSLGIGLQEQVLGRFLRSGVFDTITVISARRPVRIGLPGVSTGQGSEQAEPRVLNDAAIRELAALANVRDVYPNLRVPVEVRFDEGKFAQVFNAAGVPMSARGEGSFQTFSHGEFFGEDSAGDCMLSLDTARRIKPEDPGSLIGKQLTLTYAARPDDASAVRFPDEFQIRRVDRPCTIVGIVERLATAVPFDDFLSGLMVPMSTAREIDAEIVTSAQSLIRGAPAAAAFNALTVKVIQPQFTQEVQDRIKDMGYAVFSVSDAMAGARNAFIVVDIILGLIGSIALAVSSLGIVNTMVMSILERTREIGIMKAIGAGNRDIRRIFLLEASAIGLLGGSLGTALGWLVGKTINFAANIYIQNQGGTPGTLFSLPVWLIACAIAFSVFVSLVAGSYPASRAARLDPIQALRHD